MSTLVIVEAVVALVGLVGGAIWLSVWLNRAP